MTITNLPNGKTRLNADEGKAIRHKGVEGKTMITEAYLSPFDSSGNWEDCDYGEEIDEEATEADKDAALETLGVDMTEG